MHIDLSKPGIRQGMSMECEVTYDADGISIGGGSCAVPERDRAFFTVTSPSKGKAILEGRYSLTAISPCDRCLKDVRVPLTVTVCEEFDIDKTPDVDVDELLYKEFLQEWPAKILCRDDCKGLCPTCGADLNEAPCGCTEGPKDPRMAAILDLFKSD